MMVPIGKAMPVDFSVKHVPDAVARRLRERARNNRRSLQQELLGILEAAAASPDARPRVEAPSPPDYSVKPLRPIRAKGGTAGARLTLDELWERARRLGAPVTDDASSSLVRRDRDERSRR